MNQTPIPELTLPGGAAANIVYRFTVELSGNVVALPDGLGLIRLFGQAPARKPVLLRPVSTTDGVRLRFSTFTGQRCVVEHSESLGSPWSARPALEGTGSTEAILDQTARGPMRFYRIRVQE